MNNYQTFNKKRQYVIIEDGIQVEIPDFITKANNRYRFDSESNNLERQCYKCKKWYVISNLEGSEWIDNHNESEYHKIKSGYGSYCKACSGASSPDIDKEITQKRLKEKCSVFLDNDQRRYLKIRAAAQDIKLKDLLSEIIDNEIRSNPIDRFIQTKSHPRLNA